MRTLSCLSARAVPSTQPLRSPQPQRRRPLVPQAAAQPAAGGEAARVGAASGAAGGWPRREQVDFVKGNSVLPYSHVTQRVLNNIITMEGARGFVTADGRISQQVEDLPEAGTVQLVLQDDPPLAKQVRPAAAGSRCPACKGGVDLHRAATPCTHCVPVDLRPSLVCLLSSALQVRNLQSAADNATRAKELQAEAFLDRLASAEAPGSQPRRLQRTPFAGADGQVWLGWTAAAGDA